MWCASGHSTFELLTRQIFNQKSLFSVISTYVRKLIKMIWAETKAGPLIRCIVGSAIGEVIVYFFGFSGLFCFAIGVVLTLFVGIRSAKKPS
jgi:hypothetical protein